MVSSVQPQESRLTVLDGSDRSHANNNTQRQTFIQRHFGTDGRTLINGAIAGVVAGVYCCAVDKLFAQFPHSDSGAQWLMKLSDAFIVGFSAGMLGAGVAEILNRHTISEQPRNTRD